MKHDVSWYIHHKSSSFCTDKQPCRPYLSLGPHLWRPNRLNLTESNQPWHGLDTRQTNEWIFEGYTRRLQKCASTLVDVYTFFVIFHAIPYIIPYPSMLFLYATQHLAHEPKELCPPVELRTPNSWKIHQDKVCNIIALINLWPSQSSEVFYICCV